MKYERENRFEESLARQVHLFGANIWQGNNVFNGTAL